MRPHPPSFRSTVVALFLALAAAGAAFADEPRAGLPAGVDPGAELILDAIRSASGGEKVGNALMAKVSLTIDWDSAQAGRRAGTHARFNLLGTFGDELSELTGDLQVASNIEAPDDVRVFEAWVEQSLGERASVLAGWNDFNAEFDVTTIAAGLLNSSFGVGPDVSQVGPSIFPRSYPGLRLRVVGENGAYAIAGGWNGVPYPVSDPVTGDEVEGTFGAVEAGWMRESYGRFGSPKLCVGLWRFRARGGDDIAAEDDAVGGFYALAEGEIALARGWRVGGFVRGGRALDESRPIRGYVGMGVRLASFLASRPDDEIAFGVARAQLSSSMRDEIGAGAETTWELNWTLQFGERFAIVPDIQYVKSPAGLVGARDAALVGLRAVITYD